MRLSEQKMYFCCFAEMRDLPQLGNWEVYIAAELLCDVWEVRVEA